MENDGTWNESELMMQIAALSFTRRKEREVERCKMSTFWRSWCDYV